MIFVEVVLFILLGFGVGLVFLVGCLFLFEALGLVPCCQLKLGLYPADSRQWQRGTLGSPSAHWRSSVTGLGIENSMEAGGLELAGLVDLA